MHVLCQSSMATKALTAIVVSTTELTFWAMPGKCTACYWLLMLADGQADADYGMCTAGKSISMYWEQMPRCQSPSAPCCQMPQTLHARRPCWRMSDALWPSCIAKIPRRLPEVVLPVLLNAS